MSYLAHLLQKHPMIPAIREFADLEQVDLERNDMIFLLNANISELPKYVDWAVAKDKLVFLHLDLAHGIGKDREGIRYLAEVIGVDGIVTTKPHLIRYAKECELTTVQRLFLVDSAAVQTGLQMVRESEPDLVEVLPGIAVPYVTQLAELGIPVIAGGLVHTEVEVEMLLSNRVIGISSTNTALWRWEGKSNG